nr:putative reverse transcriptase domain-containing protein [Tanacetum cinerariifolium]
VENLDKQVEFHLDDDNVLWQGTRLVVPNDASLRETLLIEAHSSPFSVHSGSTKMYHDLKQYFWWSGMKRDVATFVSRLPQTQRRHDAIWVVVDRLTKSAHFLPIRKDYTVSKLAETFQQEIVGERVIEGPEMIEVTNEKVAAAKEKLKEARTRQKSYANKHRRSLEF